jgi:hypothetical protein
MNVNIAKEIAQRVAHLAELAATFTALYGKNYRMTAESPARAWEQYQEIMAEQAHIAGLLDVDALSTAHSRYGEWWKRQEVMDSAIVNELAIEVFNLIGRCAYMETNTTRTNTALAVERSIAGILHPATRQTALENATLLVRKAV